MRGLQSAIVRKARQPRSSRPQHGPVRKMRIPLRSDPNPDPVAVSAEYLRTLGPPADLSRGT